MKTKHLFVTTLLACLLAYVVILLGAYTRLADAGLGCPDWPVCYGQIAVPQTHAAKLKAAVKFPGQTIEPAKAWKEMVHRYFAGTLGLLLLVIAGTTLIKRRKDRTLPLIIPILLIGMLFFQAALGMWTVTWKLLPPVVMGHLLGGFTLLALLWSMALQTGQLFPNKYPIPPKLKYFAVAGLVILALQIFLGGWTSSNYAAVICTDFPQCKGSLFPHMDFAQAFNFFRPIGANYEGGLLDTTARVTIQMTHRYGAFITGLYFYCLSLYLMMSDKTKALRGLGWLLFSLVSLQIALGVLNVEFLLPKFIAVSHNGVAALLLVSTVTLVYRSFKDKAAS